MTSLWASTVASLDDALALLGENVARLQAAKPADLAEIMEQFRRAVESGRMLRELVSAEMPEAAWRTRAELDALMATEAQDSGSALNHSGSSGVQATA
jgi:hypothetical protein